MPILPARRTDLLIDTTETGLLVRDPLTSAVHQLSPLAATTFQACDGETAVADVVARVKAAHPGADDKLVWSALDELGSANLLSVRAAPPAGPIVNRRTMLRSVFAATAATAAGAAFGILPGTTRDAFGKKRERHFKHRERQRKVRQGQKANEEACKSDVRANRKLQEEDAKAADPAFRKNEQVRKKLGKQSEETQKDMRRSVGLESTDGDWRAPVAIDGEKGVWIEGQVDIHSFALDGEVDGACAGSMTVLLRSTSPKAHEQSAKAAQQLVRSGEPVTVSFSDEPGLDVKISRADASNTEFDEKGSPTGGLLSLEFTLV